MTAEGDAVDIVSRYLRLVEARRLDEATEYLASGVRITFPGGRQFRHLEEQVASSARRFQRVRKVFETIDVVAGDDAVVVYVLGTLEGEDVEGTEFSGVRYIDRFEVRGGRIVDQKVWNDMAETGVVKSGPPSS